MANQIKLKRGSGSNPGTSDLVVGEVALRTDNGTLFTKKDDGNIAEIGAATGVSDGDKGDITVSNSGATFTIDSGVIDNANVASNAAIAGSKISPTFSSQILVHQATAPQIRINTSSSDSSSTRFMFGLATASNQFINGSSSNDSCFSAPSNILFGIGNSRKFRIKSNDVLTDIDFIPSSNDATSLGRTDARWSDLFAVDGNISGNLDVGGNINLPDSTGNTVGRLMVGSDSDMQIQHSGSGGFIGNFTGNLTIHGNALRIMNGAKTESFIKADENGAVELYHNNTKRIETTSSGATVTGNISVTGTVDGRDVATDGTKLDGIEASATADQTASEIVALIADQTIAPSAIDMEDDEKIKIGAGDDLEIYHLSNSSFILNKTGNLHLLGDSILIKNRDNDESYIRCTDDAAVELYFNNSKRIETTNAGATITGDATISQDLTVRGIAATGNFSVNNTNPSITLIDDSHNFKLDVNGNLFAIRDNTNVDAIRFSIDDSGTVEVDGNLDVGAGLDVTGNITVTGNVDGRNVANDGSKLDGIESGATADQSASEILTLIKTVDGSGSGLDADTLDGVSSGSFLRSDASDTCSGAITFNADCSFSGGGGAVSIVANSDISFANGSTWSGNHTKITHHGNYLYIVGGSNGIAFRESGTNRAFIDGDGHFIPGANNTYDLGSNSTRWRNVYTSDLVLSNEGSKNDVDMTWGSFRIQEGHHDLFLINKRTGKKYKFNLTEVN